MCPLQRNFSFFERFDVKKVDPPDSPVVIPPSEREAPHEHRTLILAREPPPAEVSLSVPLQDGAVE
jgi:hypothetical protein